jgi:hypothetical protein
MKYGPEGPTVAAFIRHLKRMTPEQWNTAGSAAGDAAWYAAGDAAWYAARDAAGADPVHHAGFAAGAAAAGADPVHHAGFAVGADAARSAAWSAATEIQGATIMRERGQPFYFLPLFGFADPEAVLAADKERHGGE